MIWHDTSLFPLIISKISGAMTLDDYTDFLNEWDKWLGNDGKFITLRIFADSAALTHPEGSAKIAKQWIKTYGEAMKAKVTAMSTTVPQENYDAVAKVNSEKLFGVPAQTFANVDDALAWLKTINNEIDYNIAKEIIMRMH